MTAAQTNGFWIRRAVIGGRGAGSLTGTEASAALRRARTSLSFRTGVEPRLRSSRPRRRARRAEPLAQLVQVQRRQVAGRVAADLLGAARPGGRALIDDPDRQRTRFGRRRQQPRAVPVRAPREPLDLAVERLDADELIVLARLPDVHDAVAVAGRQEAAARPE